jgi:hypothetical protein
VELIGLYFVACVLLIAAGLAKAIHPADTARALAGLVPLPPRPLEIAVRTGAVGEAVLGAVALALPVAATAWLVAASYLAFAAVVAVLLRRGGAIASCGCFGTPDTPATAVHVAIDLVLAISALSVALDGPTGSVGSLLRAQPLDGVPLVAASALCAWLTFLAISTLSRVEGARRVLGISRHSVPHSARQPAGQQ